MRSFQFIILFIMVDDVGNRTLLIEASLVNGIFGKVRFDDVEFAQMSATLTVIADAFLLVVMGEVCV